MDWIRLQYVMVICIPVFGMIALGAILQRRGILNADHRHFANWLTYNFSLPALIFLGVSKQRFIELFDIPLISAPLLATILITIIFMILARLLKLEGTIAAAFIFGTFWANVSYMGFPLASNAFGDTGLGYAAIYNAFVMPTFFVIGFLLIGIYGNSESTGSAKRNLLRAFSNPIFISAILGMLTAFIAEKFRDSSGELMLPGAFTASLEIGGAFLKLIGSMGLPLALLSVGGSMHFSEVRKRLWLLLLVVIGKLVLFPLFTLLILRLFFPEANPVAAAVAVMLAATPNAVASYVVARQVGVEEGFVSSMLVISTALSVISIPLWLYIAL